MLPDNQQDIIKTAADIGEKISTKLADHIEKNPKPKKGRIIAGHISRIVSKVLAKRRKEKPNPS